jgi:hypothetical protein
MNQQPSSMESYRQGSVSEVDLEQGSRSTPNQAKEEAGLLDREAAETAGEQKRGWFFSLVALGFILLQSACTAVMAVSGVRVIIGLGALAAASGLNRPAEGFHSDAIRIPMMVIAIVGSLINLYVIWRIRSLRNRPAAQWRRIPPTPRQIRSEWFQIALAILTFLLVIAEWLTHRIVHNV